MHKNLTRKLVITGAQVVDGLWQNRLGRGGLDTAYRAVMQWRVHKYIQLVAVCSQFYDLFFHQLFQTNTSVIQGVLPTIHRAYNNDNKYIKNI